MNEEHKRHDSELLARRAAQVQQGGARAAVLGVNDGLVSTLCIVLAVAGAGSSQQTVLLAGVAGLVAGSISMAAGEWISVKSQVELFQGVLGDLKQMIKDDKELLVEQLRDSLEKNGYSTDTAGRATRELATNEHHLFNRLSQHVIGLNPEQLGSPWVAAISSFLLFAVGALIALAPWFFGGGPFAIILSIVLTALGGLAVGAYIGISSGNSVSRAAMRQLLIILLASAVTYSAGQIFGTVI
ncbi:VIT1/CCC1 transporter family protein [Candidatus Saccharibacteria bacterium]|nr:VIT1/CCC1 transporter family protein [Candidatus Saccharibacteria bacterium]